MPNPPVCPSASQIRRRYIDFFVKQHGHKEIPSASLIPENDPTVLFTTAGMHPLVPYLMGEPHPAGKRLVNVQKCIRTDDIDEVGDSSHLTFFEMLGNWSLGDYFKEEAINMSFSLLTLPWEKGGFGLDSRRIFVSCFEGNKDAPRDMESAEIWLKAGIPEERIFFFSKKKNWWGPAGKTGPCGPDTEMFYDVVNDKDLSRHKAGYEHNPRMSEKAKSLPCDPSCDCGRYVEIWNDVFMQYNKKADGAFEPLKQKNVDTGLGFERLVSILHGKKSPFETELFEPVISQIFKMTNYDCKTQKAVYASRVIADHLRAAVFILGDTFCVMPCNVDQGYVLRRLIRRAIRYGKMIEIEESFAAKIADIYINQYKEIYSELGQNRERIVSVLQKEEEQFTRTIQKGLKQLENMVEEKYCGKQGVISGQDAFYIFETYGFPPEMTAEEGRRLGISGMDMKGFDAAFKKHQQLSRAGAEKKFAGGLTDFSEAAAMHHTATHLLQQALRDVLGSHVAQRGSNVTAERLRFDFTHSQKMTPEELKKVEEIVNRKIAEDLSVRFEMMTVDEAKAAGATGLFEEKYASLGEKVKVYFIDDYSKEICGGPHVKNTGVLKKFRILKEEAVGAGIRRIKAVAEGVIRPNSASA